VPPAARVTDMHVCPLVTPGVPPIPHVGGPITGPGVPTVLIGGMPASVVGDIATCTGPPDTVVKGSSGVLIGGRPAARMGDTCAHGGAIVRGCPTVLIGETIPGAPPPVVAPTTAAVNVPSTAGPSGSAASQSGTGATQQPPAPQPARSAAPKGGTQQTTAEKNAWVAFKLVDEDGKPVVGEKYRLQLPDGSTKEGMTDMNGEVTVRDVAPGTCKISFPNLNDEEWKTV
jgi:uncharacterized Zn-binding protein involved in type VI secretion